MRFAYIDSQGKEVSIPSADALRLRIELGAIVDSTMFHDASTDKWAAASDHEIYRTLKREIDGDDGSGFIAPPPPTLGVASAEPPAPTVADEAATPEEARVDEPVVEASIADLAPDEPVVEASIADLAPDEPVEEAVMDLSALEPDEAPVLADEPIEAAIEPPADEMSDFSSFGDLTLDDGMDGLQDDAVEGAESPAADASPDPMDFDLGGLSVMDDDEADEDDAEAEEESGFDMGGFGDLALADDEPADEPAADEAARWDVSADLAGAIPGADFGQDELVPQDEAPTGFEGGLEVETFDASADADEAPSWLADDSPQSAAVGGQEPAYGAADSGPVDEDGLPARPEQPEGEEAPARPKRTPPPQRKLTPAKSGGIGTILMFLALLGVVGTAGWFGFQMLGSDGGDSEESTVVLPEIPANLEPQLRQLAARANLYMVSAMQSLPEREAIPDEPPSDWLLGIYLGNASRYPEVVDYWQAYQSLLREVQARDDQFFEEGFAGELAAANLSATNNELLDARALAGFEAALRDRQLVYSQLQQVITAALDLHQFLVDNETDISYEPAAGGLSRDPVLEAVPVTEALGNSMINQMAAISGALDELGFLDRITTDQLLAVFFEKLQVTSIR